MLSLLELLLEDLTLNKKFTFPLEGRFLDDFGHMRCMLGVQTKDDIEAIHLEKVAWNIGFEGEPYSLLKPYEVWALQFGVDLHHHYKEGRKDRLLEQRRKRVASLRG